MRIILILLFHILLFSAFGCGVDSSTELKEYKYGFSYNDCHTGNHTFSSLSDLCHALQNEELNRYCAQDQRRSMFERECPGSYTPF